MKIYKTSQNSPDNKPAVIILSLQAFVEIIDKIKGSNANVISIRDPMPKYLEDKRYQAIDQANFENIYIATFDDLEYDFEEQRNPSVFPKKTDVYGILSWAKTKWEENHRPFVIHCTAGVSRSSAIGILINQMIQNTYNNVFDPKYHSPNKKILQYGEEYLQTDHITKDVHEKVKKYDSENPDIF